MSKILSHNNGEMITAIGLLAGSVLLIAVNLAVAVPALMTVYAPEQPPAAAGPIDTTSVNEALKALEGR